MNVNIVPCDKPHHNNYLDLTGNRFGMLFVEGIYGYALRKNGYRSFYWKCRCDCGGEKISSLVDLRNGDTKSCGCFRRGRAKNLNVSHNSSFTPEYRSWYAMKQRCLYIKHVAYKNYGGRGISVCERWVNSFRNFLSDMGPRPDDTSLDRFPNNDGNYEPGNCRWATKGEQAKNKRHPRCKRDAA